MLPQINQRLSYQLNYNWKDVCSFFGFNHSFLRYLNKTELLIISNGFIAN